MLKTIEHDELIMLLGFSHRPSFGGGLAGRHEKGEDLTDLIEDAGNTPRFGFYWWAWKPEWSNNGGKFNRRDVVDYNAHWLCFHAHLTFWPQRDAKPV